MSTRSKAGADSLKRGRHRSIMIVNWPLLFGMPGLAETIVIFIVLLLVFGERLPDVARRIGKIFGEARDALRGLQDGLLKADPRPERRRHATRQHSDTDTENTQNTPVPGEADSDTVNADDSKNTHNSDSPPRGIGDETPD